MARPSKWSDKYTKIASKLAKRGFTMEELADTFDVATSTFYLWMKQNEELSEALKESRAHSDDLVEASLYKRATGFSMPETKVFTHEGEVITQEVTKHYAPDTVAAIFWLKNRRRDQWSTAGVENPDINIKLSYNLDEGEDEPKKKPGRKPKSDD